MTRELAYNILEILNSMREAAECMRKSYEAGSTDIFWQLAQDLQEGLVTVRDVARQNLSKESHSRLEDACTCALESLKDIMLYANKSDVKAIAKMDFELEAILEVMTINFYCWEIVEAYGESIDEFNDYLLENTSYSYLKGEQTPECDLSIYIQAYNKLEYTRQCVESLLMNMPRNINSEIILYNHGSTDGTKEYFESIPNVKVVNVAVNGAVKGGTLNRAVKGKYTIAISNDILVGANAIENLYRCVSEHEDYGYVVPTTPNISNLQSIPASYSDVEGFYEFTKQNNIYDEKKHEMRVRLCNPVTAVSTYLNMKLLIEGFGDKEGGSFPDDKISLWMRRHKYKNILAKDSYCHHFGSVTIKEELRDAERERQYYVEGRKAFIDRYGIDPWGKGVCYDYNFFKNWSPEPSDNEYVLGINCGLGSDSLKIKEIMKEKGAKGTMLHNCTQNERYLQDLEGISDRAFVFASFKDIKKITGVSRYKYIVTGDVISKENAMVLIKMLQDTGMSFYEFLHRSSEDTWNIIKETEVLR